MKVQAEISLYPLRTENLSEPIGAFCRALLQNGLEVDSGPMSTRISGEAKDVFGAIERAFEKTARDHQVVLSVKLSNACPDECKSEDT